MSDSRVTLPFQRATTRIGARSADREGIEEVAGWPERHLHREVTEAGEHRFVACVTTDRQIITPRAERGSEPFTNHTTKITHDRERAVWFKRPIPTHRRFR